VREFDLKDHEAIREEQLKVQAKTGVVGCTKVREVLVSDIFYHAHVSELFVDVTAVQRAIENYNTAEDSVRKAAAGNPLNHAMDAATNDDEKTDAVRCRYAFRHWKDQWM
jgi:hypothetical protein